MKTTMAASPSRRGAQMSGLELPRRHGRSVGYGVLNFHWELFNDWTLIEMIKHIMGSAIRFWELSSSLGMLNDCD